MRVLFVDDEVLTPRAWRRSARSRLGATVFTASCMRTGITTFDRECPDTLGARRSALRRGAERSRRARYPEARSKEQLQRARVDRERNGLSGATRGFARGGRDRLHLQDRVQQLLRVLESKDFYAMGSNRRQKSDAWVIAATHVDLQARIRDGRFREDLYRRLAKITLAAPSLAERCEDVAELAETFGERASTPIVFTDEALDWLTRRLWPGNVRELQSVMENLLAFVKTRPIDVGDLERIMTRPGLAHCDTPASLIEKVAIDLLSIGGDFGANLDAAEQAALQRVLREHGYNQSAAARALGMERNALLRRLNKG